MTPLDEQNNRIIVLLGLKSSARKNEWRQETPANSLSFVKDTIFTILIAGA
jgi:hypothetical protein